MASIIMCLAIYLLFVKSYLLVCVPNGQNSEPDIKKKYIEHNLIFVYFTAQYFKTKTSYLS